MLNIDQLKAGLELRNVSRFATKHLPVRQAVDQHSFRATLIYAHLGGSELLAMLTHDLEEALTSDIPGPIKKDLQGLDKFEEMYRVPFVDKHEAMLGKLSDKLELVLDLKAQRKYYGSIGEALIDAYERELELALDIARELKMTTKVKKLLKDAV